MTDEPLHCLVTGATGYIGGRLVPQLLAEGHAVRCLARTPGKLRRRPWFGRVEVVQGDITDADAVRSALQGMDVAYYLVHAMGGGGGFEETDRRAALIFGEQANAAGLRRIVYLGGLTPAGVPEQELSPHLRSRAEVGRILLASGVPTVMLRAAVIIGSGSASFEMLRHLTERLPVMVTPRWVRTRIQPIAIADVLRLLVGCARLPKEVNRTFDIGGPDVVTYREMMRRYALIVGLPKRLIIPVPVLSPGLSSYWIGLVTPVPSAIARPLTESLRHEVVCGEQDILHYLPEPPGGFLSLDSALRLALRRIRGVSDATAAVDSPTAPTAPSAPSDPLPTDPAWAGGSLYTAESERTVNAPAQVLWRVVERDAGSRFALLLAQVANGWLSHWRVADIRPGSLLRLQAGPQLPGQAWLELSVRRNPAGGSVYRQRALFHPHGLLGHAFWWGVAPLRAALLRGMAWRAAAEAERSAARPSGPVTDRDQARAGA